MRIFLFLFLLLAACTPGNRKPEPYQPKATPNVVEVLVPTYVPIPKELTKPCAWVRSAPLEEIPSVARGRKKCLDVYEANFKAIDLIEGQPAPTQ